MRGDLVVANVILPAAVILATDKYRSLTKAVHISVKGLCRPQIASSHTRLNWKFILPDYFHGLLDCFRFFIAYWFLFILFLCFHQATLAGRSIMFSTRPSVHLFIHTLPNLNQFWFQLARVVCRAEAVAWKCSTLGIGRLFIRHRRPKIDLAAW